MDARCDDKAGQQSLLIGGVDPQMRFHIRDVDRLDGGLCDRDQGHGIWSWCSELAVLEKERAAAELRPGLGLKSGRRREGPDVWWC